MGWRLDGSSVGRELKTGAGPTRRERSLPSDVAYDVQRVLYRKWIIVAIEYLLKLGFFVLCGWLIWRGIVSLMPGKTQTAAIPESPVVQNVSADASASAPVVGAPIVVICVLGVLLLPVVTMPLVRKMVAKRSNGVNAVTLGLYTATDMMLAYFMAGMSLATTKSVVIFIGASIFSLIYNVAVMNYAVRLEDGK